MKGESEKQITGLERFILTLIGSRSTPPKNYLRNSDIDYPPVTE